MQLKNSEGGLLSQGGWVLITVDFGGGRAGVKNDYVICERPLIINRYILCNFTSFVTDIICDSDVILSQKCPYTLDTIKL